MGPNRTILKDSLKGPDTFTMPYIDPVSGNKSKGVFRNSVLKKIGLMDRCSGFGPWVKGQVISDYLPPPCQKSTLSLIWGFWDEEGFLLQDVVPIEVPIDDFIIKKGKNLCAALRLIVDDGCDDLDDYLNLILEKRDHIPNMGYFRNPSYRFITFDVKVTSAVAGENKLNTIISGWGAHDRMDEKSIVTGYVHPTCHVRASEPAPA